MNRLKDSPYLVATELAWRRLRTDEAELPVKGGEDVKTTNQQDSKIDRVVDNLRQLVGEMKKKGFRREKGRLLCSKAGSNQKPCTKPDLDTVSMPQAQLNDHFTTLGLIEYTDVVCYCHSRMAPALLIIDLFYSSR
jgi:hypothetical protein